MELSNQTSLIWDSRSITAFLTNPNGIFPGTKMIAEPLNFKDAILISKFLTKKKDTE
jgi:cytochrome c2